MIIIIIIYTSGLYLTGQLNIWTAKGGERGNDMQRRATAQN